MSEMLHFSANELGKVHVISTTWPEADLHDANGGVTPLAETLGVALDPRYVDVIDVAGLGLGLSDYLVQAHDVFPSEAERLALDVAGPTVLLILSPAVEGPLTVGLPDDFSLVVSLTEPKGAHTISVDPVPETAQGNLDEAPPPKMSEARVSGMVAMVALLVIFALFGLMIWVAS